MNLICFISNYGMTMYLIFIHPSTRLYCARNRQLISQQSTAFLVARYQLSFVIQVREHYKFQTFIQECRNPWLEFVISGVLLPYFVYDFKMKNPVGNQNYNTI